MERVAERPLVAELVRTRTPHVRVSSAGLRALDQFGEKLAAGHYELQNSGCICEEGGKNRVLVGEEDRYGLPFRTYLCKDCGLLFTTPRMSEKSVAEFYEVDYRPIYRGKEKATAGFFDDQIRHGRQILKRVPGNPRRVFDIGCGAGGVLMPFKEQGAECFGCDFGADYLERGKQAGLTLETGNAETLRKHGPADLIIASHVLEHCLNPIEELRSWSGLLAEGGQIYIEVPGLFEVYRNYKSLAAFFHVAHTFNFTLGTLTDVAGSAGLKMLDGNESVWALFSPSTDIAATSPNRADAIERFLRRGEKSSTKIPRELRRHSLRLARSAAKRLSFGRP